MEKNKVNKAQGMYPTPISLVKKSVHLSFSKSDLKKDYYLIEPGAGTGNYVIGYWECAFAALDKRSMERLVANTICFENHKETFGILKSETEKWLRSKNIASRPSLIKDNFLLSAGKHIKTNKPIFVIGNPAWDEYTTRKHDETNITEIKEIRNERNKEHEYFRSLGHKNVYQSFLHVIFSLSSAELTLSFVLPRQFLGDKSSSELRKEMLSSGVVKINSFKNKDNPEYEFECVDKNFEIILLTYKRTSHRKSENLFVCRGLERTYFSISAIGEDATIPCPSSNEEIELNADLLSRHSLEEWADRYGVEISMGKVKHYEAGYNKALSGKTISPYDVHSGKTLKLVLNKILPNSNRKIKAALVSSNKDVNESLVEISCPNQEVLHYLYLMLNSKAIDSALRSLVSNINLNIFRLLSLPIPAPDEVALRQSRKLVDRILKDSIDPNRGSQEMSEKVFGVRASKLKMLEGIYFDHAYGKDLEKAA
ncbi:Eco57I restriction-modification methylase domain-containing protein [Bdellovibrio bacteriovorus]|uniref:Putative type II restriction m6 adenine DNA methyltransferase n=1 Tax=Bdellovibrio bacteriovorus str. Tiberius TaxID=1069642 RepID=K7Z6W4_BDEBC|nr:Eco57I restriction-modification methylase domain-containing protein [Bdellovibrio bacteriovorus]AFX99938.1 putative type II restriction m6 adenine DNA methyltransferase [Bdellovibrio bacteriovorus str. Tiberius]